MTFNSVKKENLSVTAEPAVATVESRINDSDGGADNDGDTDSHQSRARH
jgi:hypothetical protein